MAGNKEKEVHTREGNHAVNQPGNPMLKQGRDDHGKARLKELAAREEADSDQTAHIRQQNLPLKTPIKQPNKATNNN